MFGGNTTTGAYHEFQQPLGDTWTWDRAAWTHVAAVGPSPRLGAPGVYDEARQVVLLYGGGTGIFGGDTTESWEWDGTRWLQLGPSQTPGSTSAALMIAFDSTSRIAVLGIQERWATEAPLQTWTWNGSDWTQIATYPTPSGGFNFAALAYDPGRKVIVYFSHQQNGQPESWTFDGSSWTRMATASGTSSKTFVMSRDDATSNVVLFGSNGDTWTWNGSSWSPANSLHTPGPRAGMAMTYDSTHGVVVLFGGDTGPGADLKHHNDVWSWNGTDWTRVTGS